MAEREWMNEQRYLTSDEIDKTAKRKVIEGSIWEMCEMGSFEN